MSAVIPRLSFTIRLMRLAGTWVAYASPLMLILLVLHVFAQNRAGMDLRQFGR